MGTLFETYAIYLYKFGLLKNFLSTVAVRTPDNFTTFFDFPSPPA
jgi:hypothetical protein